MLRKPSRLVAGGAWLLVLALPAHHVSATTLKVGQAAQLAAIERTTQSIRQLHQKRPVHAAFDANARFNSVVNASVRRDTPNREIELSQKELVFLGWIKKTDSYRKIVFQGMTSQVIGLYDLRVKTLYVRSNNNEAFGVRRDVIAHEYTHALQDQYYNLNKLLPDESTATYRNSDRLSAIHALTEGDAVTTQVLYVARNYSPTEYKAWVRAQQVSSPGPTLPQAVQREFYFPYDDGVRFAETLYKSGGMKSIDGAYTRLPASTYEIMHPTAYLHGWRPAQVVIHGVQGFQNWKQLDDDVLGAFGYQLLIWEYLPKSLATHVTDSYRGDRYVFLERGKQDAALFRSQWTNHGAAVRARNALVSAIRHRYANTAVSSTTTRLVRTPDGAVDFTVKGAMLDMAYGPSGAEALKLASAHTT